MLILIKKIKVSLSTLESNKYDKKKIHNKAKQKKNRENYSHESLTHYCGILPTSVIHSLIADAEKILFLFLKFTQP